MQITTYRHLLDPQPVARVEADWSGLVLALTTPRDRPRSKDALGLWSPAELVDGGRRSNAAVLRVHALVLDYDGGARWEHVLSSLSRCKAVWHTTWSSTREQRRARVAIAIQAPAAAEHWPAVARWALSRWTWADKACSDASRAYYLPCAGADGSWDCGTVAGEPLDVSHLRVVPPVRATRKAWGGSMRVEEVAREGDPAWRVQAGEAAGARLVGDTMKGATCPACGDRSVWWAVEPHKNPRAMCNHRNSCGWTGPIREVKHGS